MELWSSYVNRQGESLKQLSDRTFVLLVFLRHLGCTFCREAVADIKTHESHIQNEGVEIAFVHMSAIEDAQAFFAEYGLPNVAHFSDPKKRLYQAFELKRGTLTQLFGFKTWLRGVEAGIIDGHGIGRLQGDGFQMPGAFLIHKNKILKEFRHESAADRPDYMELCTIQNKMFTK